ncbi:MAG: glycosyltransferase family 39 protein [Opitutaceae bacterium]|nr:glycosyltransferase family 39 protein [Opitutaceae bacterium]
MNRLLVLAALNGLLAVLIGFVVLPPEQALAAIKYGGYWLMLVTAVCATWQIGKSVQLSLREWKPEAADWRTLASIPAGWLLLMLHEPVGFKILMDEVMLLGTSMSLHLDKLVQVPYRGHDIQGAFVIVEGVIDKRPYFFPFLLSVFHDIAGYRPENAFILNGCLAAAFLLLIYALGRKLAGPVAGAVGVLLFAGLPLLAQNATGGGFELLNLVMIGLTLWLAIRFAETRAPLELSALCFATVLLAQTRYESALFVAPVALVILWVWWRERRPVLSWTLAFTPLLLLPVPLLQKVFQLRQASWEMFSQPGAERPFSPEFIVVNVAHAFAYFFDTTGGQPNSLLISALGLLGLGFLLLHLIRTLPQLRTVSPPIGAASLVSLGLLALFGLLMCYFWGKFDDPVITRLSLPIHLLFVLALWLVVPSFPASAKVWRGLLIAAGVQIVALSIPSMASHAYTLNYVHGREVAWRREFIAQHPARDYLVVDSSSIFWITHRVSSTPPLQARLRKEALAFHWRNRSFSAIYVYQRFDVDPASGQLKLLADFDPGPDYVLETVVERRLHPYSLSRISRVVAIREGDPLAVPPAPEPAMPALSDEEKLKLKQAYWDNWLRNLP